MINTLEVSNFKGLKKLIIPKLSRLTLIGGKNNCGKTSVLEAMFMLFDRTNPHIVIRQANWRGVNVLPVEPDFMWGPIFYDFDMSLKIKILANMTNLTNELIIDYDSQFNKNIRIIQAVSTADSMTGTHQQPSSISTLSLIFKENETIIEKSNLAIDINGFGLNIEHSSGNRKKIIFFPSRQPSNLNEDAERLGRLDIEGGIDDVIDVLKVVIPELKDLTAVRVADSQLIYADVGRSKKIPLSYMGGGISRLLAIVLAIATNKDGIVFIDEIENGLHYSAHKNLWKGIYASSLRFNCQVIATTHSYEFVASANAAMEDNSKSEFTYVRLQNNNDSVQGKCFDSELLQCAIKSDMEVR